MLFTCARARPTGKPSVRTPWQSLPIPMVANRAGGFFRQSGHLVFTLAGAARSEPEDRRPQRGGSENVFEPPTGLWWPAWEQVAANLRDRRSPPVLDARQFTFDSTYVTAHAELADYARPSFAPGRSLLDCVTELTQRIFAEFTFDGGATTIGTPVLDVLHHRHGVCQDFAHLQIGCLRSLGLAARYVSGYLVTKPPPGRPRLVGADTSHAWVSVYFPDYGWIDFDPTNGVIPSDEHITVGWARDYDDVSPVRGVVVGGRRHSLSVSVDVEPMTDGWPLP